MEVNKDILATSYIEVGYIFIIDISELIDLYFK